MSNKVYVGRKAKEVKASPSFSEYTKVVIIAGEDENGDQIVYEAGTDTGSTLEVTNPWGTQQIANDMLARIQGYAYKPISADGAILTPAAELGDGFTAGGEYSVIASQSVRFDTLHASDIEAPDNGELEHEMPEYASAADRKINRKFSGIQTTLKVNYDSITAEIEDLESDLDTQLSIMSGEIASKITSAQAQSIISQTVDGISLNVSTGLGGTTFTLTGDGTTLSTQTLDLHVQSVNIDGTITADALVANASITSPIVTGGTINGAIVQSTNQFQGVTYGTFIQNGGIDVKWGDILYGRMTLGDALGRFSIYTASDVDMSLSASGGLYLSSGKGIILDSDLYGTSLPTSNLTTGRLFFKI